jgi:hypothetical protein
MKLNPQQVKEAFRKAWMEENHDFLEEDLVILANAFVEYAEPLIRADELKECVKVATDLNRLVGERLAEVRG